MPFSAASATTNSSAGVVTIGASSFGSVLVNGRKRVPRPAAGISALRTVRLVMFFRLSGHNAGMGRADKQDVREELLQERRALTTEQIEAARAAVRRSGARPPRPGGLVDGRRIPAVAHRAGLARVARRTRPSRRTGAGAGDPARPRPRLGGTARRRAARAGRDRRRGRRAGARTRRRGGRHPPRPRRRLLRPGAGAGARPGRRSPRCSTTPRWSSQLPSEPWDLPVTAVVTPSGGWR